MSDKTMDTLGKIGVVILCSTLLVMLIAVATLLVSIAGQYAGLWSDPTCNSARYYC